MAFQDDPDCIRWRLHLAASPASVYEMLSTDQGRARFWAESAVEVAGQIDWRFPNGETITSRILEKTPGKRFVTEYFGGSIVSFTLEGDGRTGTDLTLTDCGVDEKWRAETTAGWASVLMALKAAADHGIDLRNHDPGRTWEDGYLDN